MKLLKKILRKYFTFFFYTKSSKVGIYFYIDSTSQIKLATLEMLQRSHVASSYHTAQRKCRHEASL